MWNYMQDLGLTMNGEAEIRLINSPRKALQLNENYEHGKLRKGVISHINFPSVLESAASISQCIIYRQNFFLVAGLGFAHMNMLTKFL